MTTDAGFMEAIIADPADDTPRLIYADWLDEHGQEERAEFIRVQCEIARLENCHVQALLPSAQTLATILDATLEYKLIELRERESELFNAHRSEWIVRIQFVTSAMHRGFVGKIGCSWKVFAANADAILAEHPVTMVKLTTMPVIHWTNTNHVRLEGTHGYFDTLNNLFPGESRGIDEAMVRQALLDLAYPRIEFTFPSSDAALLPLPSP